MLFTVQEIVQTAHLNDALDIKLLTNTGEHECLAQVETVAAPPAELLMKAKIQFAKKRLFDHIQTLQQKNLQQRREIYEIIKQSDQ